MEIENHNRLFVTMDPQAPTRDLQVLQAEIAGWVAMLLHDSHGTDLAYGNTLFKVFLSDTVYIYSHCNDKVTTSDTE